MIVRMWMTRDVLTISPDQPVREAAQMMARRGIRRLPVILEEEPGPRLVGIVTAHDILHYFPADVNPFCVADERLDAESVTVSKLMSFPVITTEPNMALEEVAQILVERKVGALPVVQDSELVGVITESDVFRAFTASLEIDQSGVRIIFSVSKNEDVVGFVVDAARRHKLRVANIISCRWEDQLLTVVGVVGKRTEGFVDEVWKSGHIVLRVAAVTPLAKEDPRLKAARERMQSSS
jgi:acetoin utilization protein AcuB